MKILILSNNDLASNYVLNMLLPPLSKHKQIHLWLSAKVGNNTALTQQLKTLKFFEQDLILGRSEQTVNSLFYENSKGNNIYAKRKN